MLGELYLSTGKAEKALENLKRAEGMFLEIGMDYRMGKARQALGEVYQLKRIANDKLTSASPAPSRTAGLSGVWCTGWFAAPHSFK